MDLSWSAAILVGGRARRLDGQPKPRLPVGGRPILERQIDALAALGVTPTLVTADATPYAGLGLPIVTDRVDAGALGGLYTALAAAPTAWVLVLAGDMPFVTPALLRLLLDARGGAEAVVPRVGGRWHPLCAAYATHVAPRLRAAIDQGTRRIGDVLARVDTHAVDDAALAVIDPAGLALTNVNTPEDLAQAAAHAAHER